MRNIKVNLTNFSKPLMLFLVFFSGFSFYNTIIPTTASSQYIMTPPYLANSHSQGEKFLFATLANQSSAYGDYGRGRLMVQCSSEYTGWWYSYSWGKANCYMTDSWVCSSSGEYRITFLYRMLEGFIRFWDTSLGAIYYIIDYDEVVNVVDLIFQQIRDGDMSRSGGSLIATATIYDLTDDQVIYSCSESVYDKNNFDVIEEIISSLISTASRYDFYGQGYTLCNDEPIYLIKDHQYAWSFNLELICYTLCHGTPFNIAEGDVQVQLDGVIVESYSGVTEHDVDFIANANPNEVDQGDHFAIIGRISNVGTEVLHDAWATLSLPTGLTLYEGSATKNYTSIIPGSSKSPEWIIYAESPGEYDFIIEVGSNETSSELFYGEVSVNAPEYEIDVIARAPDLALLDNEFTVTGQIQNKRVNDINGVSATLELSDGLSLTSGLNPQNISTILGYSEENVTWTVRADSEGLTTLSITAICDEGVEDTDYESINIYDIPSISIEFFTSDKALINTPFRLEAFIENNGDITLHDVYSTLIVPPGLNLVYTESHPNPDYEDRILPGSDHTPVWYLEGDSGTYTIGLEVNSSEGSSEYKEIEIEVVGSIQEPFLLWNFTTGNDVIGVDSGDLDGDGISDVAITSLDNKVYAIKSNGTELWNYSTTGYLRSVAIGDINGDGFEDVITGGNDGYVYALNGSNGNPLTGWPKWSGGTTTDSIYDIQIGDFDGDGIMDVASSTVGMGNVYAFRGYDGNQLWHHSHGEYVKDIGIGDINGDGKDDVAVGVWSTPGEVYAYRGYDGTTLWGPYSIDDEARTVDVGDLTGDGKCEVVVGMDRDTTHEEVYAIKSDGTLLWDTDLGWRVEDVKIGDLDGDGDNEVAVGADSPQDSVSFLEGSNGNKITSVALGVGADIYSVCIGDLDNDGINDVAAGGSLGKVWAINSTGFIIWNYSCGGDIYLHSISIADVNADGTHDVIAGSWDNSVYILSCKPLDQNGPSSGLIRVKPNPTSVNPFVNATISDDFSIVTSAEYFVDSIGANDTGVTLNPIDDNWNTTSEIVEGTIDISILSDGIHTIYIHGKDAAGYWGEFNSTEFEVDRVSPIIILLSPKNITYKNELMELNVTANEDIDNWSFSLNGGKNITFMPNTLIFTDIGVNNLIVYANDTSGNTVKSNITWTNQYYTDINCTLSKSQIYLGDEVNITAILTHPAYEGNITIQYYNNSKWNNLYKDNPQLGTLSHTWIPQNNGTYLLRTMYSGSSLYSESNSSTKQIEVLTASNLYCLVRGNNNRIYFNEYSDSWSGWDSLTGSTSNRIAGAFFNGDLHTVVKGMSGGLYHAWLDLGTETFSGWSRLSGDTPSDPVLTASPEKLYLIVRGNNDRIYYREWDGSWSSWMSISGKTNEGIAATVVDDELHIVVIGTNGRLYHGTVNTTDYSFSGWNGISGTTLSQPVLADDESSVYLVVRGNNNRIYLNEYTGTWGGWTGLPGSTGMSPGAAVYDGDLHLVVKGMTGGLYHGTMDLSSHIFGGWTRLSGDTPSPPTLSVK